MPTEKIQIKIFCNITFVRREPKKSAECQDDIASLRFYYYHWFMQQINVKAKVRVSINF